MSFHESGTHRRVGEIGLGVRALMWWQPESVPDSEDDGQAGTREDGKGSTLDFLEIDL